MFTGIRSQDTAFHDKEKATPSFEQFSCLHLHVTAETSEPREHMSTRQHVFTRNASGYWPGEQQQAVG
jgi:hypothetical protein